MVKTNAMRYFTQNAKKAGPIVEEAFETMTLYSTTSGHVDTYITKLISAIFSEFKEKHNSKPFHEILELQYSIIELNIYKFFLTLHIHHLCF